MPLKLLLTPRTLAATAGARRSSGEAFSSFPKRVVKSSDCMSLMASIRIELGAREKESAEDGKGGERQHDGDRIGRPRPSFVELGEDVERRRDLGFYSNALDLPLLLNLTLWFVKN
jgi:hypothetical protein